LRKKGQLQNEEERLRNEDERLQIEEKRLQYKHLRLQNEEERLQKKEKRLQKKEERLQNEKERLQNEEKRLQDKKLQLQYTKDWLQTKEAELGRHGIDPIELQADPSTASMCQTLNGAGYAMPPSGEIFDQPYPSLFATRGRKNDFCTMPQNWQPDTTS
jgi:hypothetical protein